MAWEGRTSALSLCTSCLVAGLAGGALAASTELTLYSRPGLGGDDRSFTSGERDLGRSGWGDRAVSVRIDGGAWELCREVDYQECTVFAPGEYELHDTRFEGRLRAQVDSIVRSPEFRGKAAELSPEALLAQIYDGLLGRPIDPGGTRTYLPRIQRHEYTAVVLTIVDSREFRRQLAR